HRLARERRRARAALPEVRRGGRARKGCGAEAEDAPVRGGEGLRAGGELLGRGAGGRARPALRARRSGEGRLAAARRPRARARARRRDAPARRLRGLAGGEPGGLRLAAGGGVLVERAVRGGPVE